MAQVQFKRGVLANRGEAVNGLLYFATDSKELFMGTASGWTRFGDGDKLVSDVTYSNGTVTVSYNDGSTSTTFSALGSVSDAAVTDQFVTAISATNGVISASRSGITASQVTRTATTGDHAVAATTVEGAIQELAAAIDAGGTGSVVTVEKQATADSGYAATYVVKQGGTQVGVSINIPKDFLVKSASIETVATANQPYIGAAVGDKYIDFVVNTVDSSETAQHIYLPVNDLVDIYTEGNGIDISNSNVVSAVVDTAANGNEFLSVSANGLKVSGVSTAINNAKTTVTEVAAKSETTADGNDFIVVTKDSSVTDHNAYTVSTNGIKDYVATEINKLGATVGGTTIDTGKHVAVQVVEANGKLTGLTVTENDIASASDLSGEVTRAQAAESEIATAVGLTGAEGSRAWTPTTNYGGSTTSAQANMQAIDTQVKTNADAISNLGTGKKNVQSTVSLDVSDNAKVMTGVDQNTNGDITGIDEKNVGELLLTGYTIGNSVGVAATDTINQAIGKLQYELTWLEA